MHPALLPPGPLSELHLRLLGGESFFGGVKPYLSLRPHLYRRGIPSQHTHTHSHTHLAAPSLLRGGPKGTAAPSASPLLPLPRALWMRQRPRGSHRELPLPHQARRGGQAPRPSSASTGGQAHPDPRRPPSRTAQAPKSGERGGNAHRLKPPRLPTPAHA